LYPAPFLKMLLNYMRFSPRSFPGNWQKAPPQQLLVVAAALFMF